MKCKTRTRAYGKDADADKINHHVLIIRIVGCTKQSQIFTCKDENGKIFNGI